MKKNLIVLRNVRFWLPTIFVLGMLGLANFSCGGGSKENAESVDSVATESPNVSSDTSAFDDSKYCCSDHSPAHCAAAVDVADLMAKHGCKSFTSN